MAEDATKLVIVLEAQSKKLQNSLVQVNRNIDRFAAQTEKRFDAMQRRNAASFERLNTKIRGSLGRLQGIIAPVVGTLGLREIVRFSDAWTTAGNKIAAASQVSGLHARSLEELKDGANGARQELSQYVDLYSRLLRVAPMVAATELEVASATDIVAKSLKAGGASAQEQAAALIQLGQAIGSGFLQGDELRSIRENAPLLAQAIADEFGVSIGELKKLGAEGEIVSERVFKAVLAAKEKIEAAFNATTSTIHDAFTRVENEFIEYIGTAGQATGATQGLIEALAYVAENFKEISNTAVQFAALLAGAFAGKAIVGGLGAATMALGAFLTALRAGTLTAGLFSAALGPIGLIAGAAAVAILMLNHAQGDAARAAELHAEALSENQYKMGLARESSDQYRAALQRQIAVQLKAADAALVEAEAQMEAAKTKALAAGIFDLGVQALGSAFGMTDGKARPSPYDDDILGAAQANIDAARDRATDLRRQLKEIDAIRLTPEGDGDRAGDGTGGGSGKSKKKKGDSQFQNAIDSVVKRTAALEAETAAQAKLNPLVNDYGHAMERAKAASDLLQAAMDQGLEITPELRAQIAALAEAYATAAAGSKKLAETHEELRESALEAFSSARDVARGWINDLIEGKSAAEALGNALSNIGNRLIDMGLDAVFGTGSGSSPFGMLGKAFGFADGGIVAHGRPQPLKRYAMGGISDRPAIFGEGSMAEAAVPLPDGRRIPVDIRMPQSGGMGGNITVSMPVTIDASGADPAAIARLDRTVATMKAELPSNVVKAVRDAKAGRMLSR